jgi:hypothetical protein
LVYFFNFNLILSPDRGRRRGERDELVDKKETSTVMGEISEGKKD